MGGPNLRDQLPVLKSVIKWFSKENIVTDSLVFRLHHQVTTFLILIGFVFTVIENYIDSKTITCYPGGQLAKYAHAYCWIHGAGYVRSHLQGVATGCYVDPDVVETNNEYSQITSYYLWLPYLLSFLFAMAKMPHSLWKRFFESNLLSSILGGMSGSDVKEQQPDDQQQQQQGQEGGEEEAEEGENKGKKKQENNNGKKQKNKDNNKNGKQQLRNPVIMARSFVQLRGVSRYNQYQFKFCLLEASNLLTLMAQILATHWILNYKFWDYGPRVANYLTVYGEYWSKGTRLHNPMCELFPTEVSCIVRTGGINGGVEQVNHLCILQNNLFNQKYFFVLWIWWMFLLGVTVLGVTYRVTRILLKPFSRMTSASSGDFFVLELVVDSLKDNPQEIGELMKEVDRVWGLSVEAARNVFDHKYEKLHIEQKKMGDLANLVHQNNKPPPYPAQKR